MKTIEERVEEITKKAEISAYCGDCGELSNPTIDIEELKTAILALIEEEREEIRQIIKNLKSKRDSFIGNRTDYVTSANAEGFKEGLSWAIDSIEQPTSSPCLWVRRGRDDIKNWKVNK